MTDISPDEAVEEILGVRLDVPDAANPCWEEKHGPAVSGFDPDTDLSGVIASDLTLILERLSRVENAVNQIGSQTNWLVQAFAGAQTAFMQMSQQLADAGPMGLIKMMTGKAKKEKDGNRG